MQSIGSFPEHPTPTPFKVLKFAKTIHYISICEPSLHFEKIRFCFSLKAFFLIQIQTENNEIDYQEFEYTGVWYLDALAIQ